jgi:hypothetical protein
MCAKEAADLVDNSFGPILPFSAVAVPIFYHGVLTTTHNKDRDISPLTHSVPPPEANPAPGARLVMKFRAFECPFHSLPPDCSGFPL